ncbi:MAG: M66 family metalloprotease [Luteolibacter sp.]
MPKFAALIAASLTGGTLLNFAQAAAPLVFDTTAPVNDLQGSLAAQVRFAQSQIIPAHPREGDRQPYLIGRRQSLLLVKPLKADDATPLSVIARDGTGKVLGSVKLDPPGKLPKTAYYLDGMPETAPDFTPKAGSESATYNGSDLAKLTKPDSPVLADLLPRNGLVTIQLADGSWVGDVHLPKGLEGKIVRVSSSAGYAATVHYSGRQVGISRGQTFQFKFVGSQWIREGELENNGIVYSEHTWSGVLPAQWIAPGLSLQVRQGNLTGDLAGLKVGAPTQLLIHTIDLGFLTPPRDRFEFAKDPEAHREYFQTLPASRLIVSQYAPLALKEVMLPDGTLLTDVDPSKGGWHEGTMRQHIGKELISLGIDNANYGINSTAGKGEGSPYLAAQLAAHNSSGKYSNGVQVHGGSGGGGIVTLDNTLGNEFSHEVGHNYGLGHYVDGFKGSVHRSADNINSTWGWDADKSRFLPNFYPTGGGKDTCLDNQCQAPFQGHSFGMDPMAGGSPHSAFNRFTLYTPNSAAIIQRFLESKVIFDAASPTGFSKWNETTSAMEPYRNKIDLTRKTDAPVSDLVEAKMTNLLAKNDVVNVGLGDGNWTANIQIPSASAENKGRAVSISHQAGYASTLFINGEQIPVSRGFKKDYVSDGKQWKEGALPEQAIERKPQAFGVPVVTLVGYYDPNGELKSYIYPALHGALGFYYGSDSNLKSEDCELQVETRSGVLRFRLDSQRINPGCMNKFHINVPESSQPRNVAIVSRGRVLDKKPITPVSEKLTFTVNGAR